MKKGIFLISIMLLLSACSGGGNTTSSVRDEPTSAVSATSASISTSEVSTTSLTSEVKKPFIDGKKLVVFGDSITAMGTWGADSAKTLNVYFYNAATGGITTAQGIERFPSFVPKQNPDFVTILFGMNDLIMVAKNTPRVSLEDFEKNLITLVNMIKQINATPILLTTNPLNPTLFWSAQGQDPKNYEITDGDPLKWLDMYNDVTRKVATENNVWLVDMRAAFSPTRYASYLLDGIHLNGKGNELFSKQLVSSFLERYDNDPNAEPVVEPDRTIYVTPDMGNVSILTENVEDWYFTDYNNIKVEINDGVTEVYNTNGKWPEAMLELYQPISINVQNGKLNFSIETKNVNTSIILFLDGATPSAYSGPSQYLVINKYLGGKIDEGSGDVLANQVLEGSIDLSTLPFNKSIIHDGSVKISGLKVFAAGTAKQKVLIKKLGVSIPKE